MAVLLAAMATAAACSEDEDAAQDAQSPNQKFEACMQQAAKDHSDGGRMIDPQGYQQAVLACMQPQQAQPAR
jgi:hypothetical protein